MGRAAVNCAVSDREAEARRLGRLLDDFLRSQPPENRMIYLRRYWFLDSVEEIAQRYGLRECTVRRYLAQTKAALETRLLQEGWNV